MLPDSAPTSIQVGNSDIPFATHARNLGIIISSDTIMDKHVTDVCRSVDAELRRISSIRHPLTVNATQTLLSAFVLSKSLLQLLPLWLTSIHSGQAPMSMKFCSKISHEIPQVWTCAASFAQPSLVTNTPRDWLQDFNSVLQHFNQLFSCLYRSASIRLHSLKTTPFILGCMLSLYSFHQD